MRPLPILSPVIPALVLLAASAEQARQLPPPDYRGTVLNSDQLDRLFRKPWFAMFGAVDRTVSTEASVKKILRYMAFARNRDFAIAVIRRCGHMPVDTETKQRVRFENLTLNWIDQNVAAIPAR